MTLLTLNGHFWRKNRFCDAETCFHRLNKKNMSDNLEWKVAEDNGKLHKKLLRLMYKNENIKSIYLDESNKILNDLPFEIQEGMYSM